MSGSAPRRSAPPDDAPRLSERLARLFGAPVGPQRVYRDYLLGLLFVPAFTLVVIGALEGPRGRLFWCSVAIGLVCLLAAHRWSVILTAGVGFVGLRCVVGLLMLGPDPRLVAMLVACGAILWLLISTGEDDY